MIEWGSIATGVGLLKNLRELFKKKEPDAYIADVRVCQASLEDSGELLPFYDLTLELYVVKRQPDGPTNRHKNDPLVRVGYLLQETA